MSFTEMTELMRGKPSFFSMRSFSGKALSSTLDSQQFFKGLRSTPGRRMRFFQIPGRQGSCNPSKSLKQLLASLVRIQGWFSSRWLHLRNFSILTGNSGSHCQENKPIPSVCQKNAQWRILSINLVHCCWVSECQEILPAFGPDHMFGPKIRHKSPLVPVCTQLSWKTGVKFLKWVYSFTHSCHFTSNKQFKTYFWACL